MLNKIEVLHNQKSGQYAIFINNRNSEVYQNKLSHNGLEIILGNGHISPPQNDELKKYLNGKTIEEFFKEEVLIPRSLASLRSIFTVKLTHSFSPMGISDTKFYSWADSKRYDIDSDRVVIFDKRSSYTHLNKVSDSYDQILAMVPRPKTQGSYSFLLHRINQDLIGRYNIIGSHYYRKSEGKICPFENNPIVSAVASLAFGKFMFDAELSHQARIEAWKNQKDLSYIPRGHWHRPWSLDGMCGSGGYGLEELNKGNNVIFVDTEREYLDKIIPIAQKMIDQTEENRLANYNFRKQLLKDLLSHPSMSNDLQHETEDLLRWYEWEWDCTQQETEDWVRRHTNKDQPCVLDDHVKDIGLEEIGR